MGGGYHAESASQQGLPLHHFHLVIESSAVNHESTVPIGMESPTLFAPRIAPSFHPLQDEHVVFVHQTGVHHLAFDIGNALGDQWFLNLFSGYWRQAKGLEFIDVLPRTIADSNDAFSGFA